LQPIAGVESALFEDLGEIINVYIETNNVRNATLYPVFDAQYDLESEYAHKTFYTALHSIEAIFCQEISLHTNTHFEREKALQKRLPAIDKTFLLAYRALYTQSHQARYMADQKFEMTNQDCEDALANLKIIETECKETYFDNYPNP